MLTGFRQLQQGKGTGADSYNGMVDCFKKIVKNEGYVNLLYKEDRS
jgi:solute carrier family 25 (mitochondrial 2-oxodicarboxylate transporter), member 21